MRIGPLRTLCQDPWFLPPPPTPWEENEVRSHPHWSCRKTGSQFHSPSPSAGALLTLPRRPQGQLQAPLKLQLQLHVLLCQLLHLMPQSVQLLGAGQGQTSLAHQGQAKRVG